MSNTATGRLAAMRTLFGMSWRADRGKTTTMIGLILARTLADGLVSLSLGWIVDAAIERRTGGAIGAALAGGLALAVVLAGSRIVTNLQMDLTERIGLLLDREVLLLSATLNGLEHLERPTYLDRLSVVRKQTHSVAEFAWAALDSVSLVIRVLVSLWLLATIHPVLLSLVVLVLAPLLLARVGQRSVQRAVSAMAAPGRREKHLFELCTKAAPAKELRVYRSGRELDGRAAALWDEVTAVKTRARVRAGLAGLLGGLVFVLGYAGALLVVTALAVSGRSTPGDIVMVINLATQVRDQTGGLASSVAKFVEGLHILDQYLWLRAYAAEQAARPATAPPPKRLERGIELDGVSFGYPDTGREVLHDVTLRLPAGTVVALVGEHGAGKTTLVKLLCGFYRPTAGTVAVDGVPLADIAPAEWLDRVSAAFQDFGRFEFLARETVGVGDLPHVDDEPAVRRALRRARAEDVVAKLPDGLATQLGKTFADGVELSTGQWQKLALGRAFMRGEPLLMIMDEPTAALDARAEQALFERYAERARELGAAHGTITVLVSHRFSTVRMADQIVVVEGGRVTQQGTHDALLRAGGAYAELYRLQEAAYR